MLINWYPGHMEKARKKVKEVMPSVDVVIEVLDARLPYSSTNPMIEELRGNKPFLKVLSKSDLADHKTTQAWLKHWRQQRATDALAITTKKPAVARTIPDRIMKLVGDKSRRAGPVTALILGIPNVGKSTLINTLAGRKVAGVGNEPAVTKAQLKIKVTNDFTLIDSPGMTWPRAKDFMVNYRLAISGAIRDTAVEYDDLGLFAMDYLVRCYPEQVAKLYGVKVEDDAIAVLDAIAKKRGCMQSRGADYQRVGELVVREMRAGKLGPVSLEEPLVSYPFRF